MNRSFTIEHRKTEKFRGRPPKYNSQNYLELIGYIWLMNKHQRQNCAITPDEIEMADFIIYHDFLEGKLYVSDEWESNFHLLLDKRSCRFIFQLFTIEHPEGDHSTMLIIDKKNKLVQYYDPHGLYDRKYTKRHEEMEKEIKKYLFVPGILENFLVPKQYCPVGPQIQQEHGTSKLEKKDREKYGEGYCISWSVWYTNIRLSYPDLSPQELEEKINKRFAYYEKQGISKSHIIGNFGLFLMKHAQRIIGNIPQEDRYNETKVFRQIIKAANTIK